MLVCHDFRYTVSTIYELFLGFAGILVGHPFDTVKVSKKFYLQVTV